MKIGTKSVLYGAHCFLLHPLFVAAGWWKLYGFPWDPRLWAAFFVHDLGYIGKPNMDGPESEKHPEFGARLMSKWFDHGYPVRRYVTDSYHGGWIPDGIEYGQWGNFALLHSRYYAKTLGLQPSRLCMADELAISLTPAWLYLPMVRATGEIHEYMAHAKHRIVGNERVSEDERRRLVSSDQAAWYSGVRDYCRRWALAHRDGAVDTWTSSSARRATIDERGVWK